MKLNNHNQKVIVYVDNCEIKTRIFVFALDEMSEYDENLCKFIVSLSVDASHNQSHP